MICKYLIFIYLIFITRIMIFLFAKSSGTLFLHWHNIHAFHHNILRVLQACWMWNQFPNCEYKSRRIEIKHFIREDVYLLNEARPTVNGRSTTRVKFRYALIRFVMLTLHYNDVIMSAMASQITGVLFVFQPFVQEQIKEYVKAPIHWPFYGESNQWIPLTKGQ